MFICTETMYSTCLDNSIGRFNTHDAIPGLFVPLHFLSRERKEHRENFRSRGNFVPWNIRSLELSVPWNSRSRERTFQELSFLWNCHIMRTNISRTFALNVLKHDLVAVNYVGYTECPGFLDFLVPYRRGYGHYSSIHEYKRHRSAVVWVCLHAWVTYI